MLNYSIFGINIFEYILVLIIVIISAFIGKIFTHFFENWLKKRAEKSKTKLDDVIVETVDKPLFYLFILLGIRIGLNYLTLSDKVYSFLANTVSILFILLITWMLSRFTNSFIREYVHKFASKTESKLDDQLIILLNRIIRIFIFATAFTIILEKFGYDVTSIVAGLGIGGLAVALAAQETLKDAFGGLSIFTSKPFVVGDAVDIEGISGKIEEIGLRYTKIRQWDNRVTYIPNSKIVSSRIINISSEPARRVNLVIGLTYDTPAERIREAREILERIFRETDGVQKDTWRVTFEEFGNFSLNLRVIYFIEDLENKFEVMHNVHLKIKEEFDKAGLEFAFPTQTIYLKE